MTASASGPSGDPNPGDYSRARALRGVASSRCVSEVVTPGTRRTRRSISSSSGRLPADTSTMMSQRPTVVWTE